MTIPPGPLCRISPDHPRAAAYVNIFGRLSDIPITHYYADTASFQNRPDVQVYYLDLIRITKPERNKLVEYLARQHGCSAREIDQHLNESGLPIVADDDMVTITNPPASSAERCTTCERG